MRELENQANFFDTEAREAAQKYLTRFAEQIVEKNSVEAMLELLPGTHGDDAEAVRARWAPILEKILEKKDPKVESSELKERETEKERVARIQRNVNRRVDNIEKARLILSMANMSAAKLPGEFSKLEQDLGIPSLWDVRTLTEEEKRELAKKKSMNA